MILTQEAATEDFIHGMRMLAAAGRCGNWTGEDELTKARLKRLGDSYRERATLLMIGSGAAQPEQVNRTPTTLGQVGSVPRAIRNDV